MPDRFEELERGLAELERLDRETDRLLAELAASLAGAGDALELAAGILAGTIAAPIAPILDALDERWPDGWHAADTLPEFDCTAADLFDTATLEDSENANA